MNNVIDGAKIVFFDLDKTLTYKDTDEIWAQWNILRSFKGIIEAAILYKLSFDYKKGHMSEDMYMKFHKFRFGSIPMNKFQKKVLKFYNSRGRNLIIPEMAELFQSYKEKGIKTVIITAQNNLIAQPFADELNADCLIANRFNFENNAAGDPVEPYCVGTGKIFWAHKFAMEQGISLNDCAFYSDSIHDLPLLSRIGYPVIVNPDKLLLEKSLDKNWPVMNFI